MQSMTLCFCKNRALLHCGHLDDYTRRTRSNFYTDNPMTMSTRGKICFLVLALSLR